MKPWLLIILTMAVLAPATASASIGAGASTLPIHATACSGSKWEVVHLSPSHGIACTAKVNLPAGKAKTLRVQCPAALPKTGYARGMYLPSPAHEWMLFSTHRGVRWDGDIFRKVDGIVTRVKVRNWSHSKQQVILAAGCHLAGPVLPRFDWGASKTEQFNIVMSRAVGDIPGLSVAPGASNDILVSSPDHSSSTGPGNDTVIGSNQPDDIRGGRGNDELRGWAGKDHVFGGPGNDVLMGQAGNDLLYGGPGNDLILDTEGVDRVFGGPGNDFINTKDGNRDFVNCGPGFDTVLADRKDRLVGCERIRR